VKLLGIEFSNFACFDRQFIAVREGVNLLVGKNNSGKTAVLRGLSCLKYLPLDEHRPANQIPLAGYCRIVSGQRQFSFDVLYQLEPDDLKFFFSNTDFNWNQAVSSGRLVLRYRFWYWSEQSVIFFSEALLDSEKLDVRNLEVIKTNQDGVFINHHSAARKGEEPTLGNLEGSTKIASTKSNYTRPGSQYAWVLFSTNELFRPLKDLTARFVSAHRVPHPAMALQTTEELPDDASNLPSYLKTLQGNDGDAYESIQRLIVDVFPEFRRLNASDTNNTVSITLSLKDGSRIPLTHCGTGVEQLLAIATLATAASRDTLLLLDEPHSFLHPYAERKLINFVNGLKQRYLIISTHSAVIMNSVEASRITKLEAPGMDFYTLQKQTENSLAAVLCDLGYRNSDLLFNDYLVGVEGDVDVEILPILLKATGSFNLDYLFRTGFMPLDGAGKGATALQVVIGRVEALAVANGRAAQPRIYVFDGDKVPDDVAQLQRTKRADGKPIACLFWPRTEIENYLFDARAICEAMKEQAALDGIENFACSEESVSEALKKVLGSEDKKAFPRGKGSTEDEAYKLCKGSAVLDLIYKEHSNLRFEKKRSGLAIAKHVSKENVPYLVELLEVVGNVWEVPERAAATQ
jgi:hypothetical protein